MVADHPQSTATLTDIYSSNDAAPTTTYRSGLVAYQESLIRSHFVGRRWHG